MADEKEDKKTKRPSALKRLIQSEKRRLLNKSFKSKVRTAVRAFEGSLTARDKASSQVTLKEVYSLMDKGVRKGVYKPNKANRTKARMAAKVASLSA